MLHTYRRKGSRAEQLPLDNWPALLARVEAHVLEEYQTGEKMATRVVDPSFPKDPAARHAESQFHFGCAAGLLVGLKLAEELLLSGRAYVTPFLDRAIPGRRAA